MPTESSTATRKTPTDYVRGFSSYQEAERHGFYSLKRLRELGLFVPDELRPCYEAMVSTHYGMYPVYGREQATGKGEKGSSDATDQDSTHNKQEQALVSSLPFDDHIVTKVVSETSLGRKFPLRRSRGENASCRAYFPDGFEAKDMAAIEGMKEEAAVLFDQLYKFRHIHGQGADEFVSLSWDHGRKLLGKRKFDSLMRKLIRLGILERTTVKEDGYGLGAWIPRGQGTGLAYGYRLSNPNYRRNYSQVIVTNKALERRLKEVRDGVRYPVQRHLRRMLEEITVEMPGESELLELCHGDEDKQEAVEGQLKAIREGKRFFTVDRKTRRIFSNLTSLKRGARRYLRVRGEAIWQVDLPCCHLLALACKCVEAKVKDAEEFLHYCERDFYSELAREGGFTRKEVKEAFTKRALNASNRHRYQRSPVMRFFRRRWKWIAAYMRARKSNGKPTKKHPKPHNRLALELQKWEANLVIFRICDGIRRERPDVWIATIHDAVVCLERDVPFVLGTVEEELKALGITLATGKLAGKPM
jgi:hypothetical protein